MSQFQKNCNLHSMRVSLEREKKKKKNQTTTHSNDHLVGLTLYGYHQHKKKNHNPSLPDVTYLCFLIMAILVEKQKVKSTSFHIQQ